MPRRPKPLTPTLLRTTLKKTLSEAGPIAVLGIGSDLRADDVAGVIVARVLRRAWGRSRSMYAAFEGGTAPENLTGEISRFVRGHEGTGRGHVVLVDTADMNLKPGQVCLLHRDDLAGVSFSTHQLPLSVLVDYIQESSAVDVTIVAIQPKTVLFGGPLSSAVGKAADLVASALRGAVSPPRAGKHASAGKGGSKIRRKHPPGRPR
jgi:hydrogenase 3 maturation protease